MKKIVINRCFGGFGLSDAIMQIYLTRKNIPYHMNKESSLVTLFKHPETEEYYNDSEIPRDDEVLVALVEEFGEAANGWAAELAIVEIPDDVKWHIHEYDGLEHVAEDHRTWR
jgi:hypothetical protein